MLQFVVGGQKDNAIIGYPAKSEWSKVKPDGNLTLDYLLKHSDNFIEDSDVDIHISCEGALTKYQITRFVHPNNRKPDYSLGELIARKCRRQQPDRRLYLVVSIEKNPSLEMDEFMSQLNGLVVPYGRIILIQKASGIRGHFRIFQLYPKIIFGKSVYTNLPM